MTKLGLASSLTLKITFLNTMLQMLLSIKNNYNTKVIVKGENTPEQRRENRSLILIYSYSVLSQT